MASLPVTTKDRTARFDRCEWVAGTVFRMPTRTCYGITLLELVFVLAIGAILATLAIGQFSEYVERSRGAKATADIVTMTVEVERHLSTHQGAYPDSLGEINRANTLDPWGNAYHYTNLTTAKGKGGARRDRRLNPLNSDYDLFSAGKNGVFKSQISQKDSLDDIIRARDGAFIGRASEF